MKNPKPGNNTYISSSLSTRSLQDSSSDNTNPLCNCPRHLPPAPSSPAPVESFPPAPSFPEKLFSRTAHGQYYKVRPSGSGWKDGDVRTERAGAHCPPQQDSLRHFPVRNEQVTNSPPSCTRWLPPPRAVRSHQQSFHIFPFQLPHLGLAMKRTRL